jgi:Flp pilus assembly protein TadD
VTAGREVAPHPDETAVRRSLDAVLRGAAFRDSPQLRAFLTFVVEEALAGRGGDIKGYAIATLALGRGADFDPQTDPIVRVQAGRLRQALAEHYGAEPDTPVIIRLEKGSYVPAFTWAARPESSPPEDPIAPVRADMGAIRKVAWGRWMALAAGCGVVAGVLTWSMSVPRQKERTLPPAEAFYPALLVEADIAGSGTQAVPLAARLREALARFDALVVIGEAAAVDMAAALPTARIRPPGRDLALRVTASSVGGGAIRYGARLIDRDDNRIVWSREFEAVAPDTDAIPDLVASIATQIAQPYGVVHAHVRSRLDRSAAGADPYGCLVSSFDYWHANDRFAHAAARTCIVDRLRDYPGSAALHAQLAYLHLEEHRHGYNPSSGDPLDRALDSAAAAVRLAPASARSHQALLAARFSRRDFDGAWRAADEALRLNPFDTDILADVGARHIQSGRFDAGLDMLRRASRLNPAPPLWAQTYEAIALYMLGRIDEASIIAAQLDSARLPTSMIAALLVAYHKRDPVKAGERLARLRAAHPSIAADPLPYLNRLTMSDLLQERILASYAAAVAWTDAK